MTVATFLGPVRYVLHNDNPDPGSAAGAVRAGPAVTGAERRHLLAAFTGGFKLPAGVGGYLQEGHVISPLRRGFTSLVIDGSGQARIGVWGDRLPAPGEAVYSVRQNLQPLVLNGWSTAASADWTLWGAALGGCAYVACSAIGQDAASDLIYAAVRTAETEAERMAGVTGCVEVRPGTCARVDVDRIRQAVDDLVDNALRSAPGGSVIVLAVRAAGADLDIEVRDDGPGFPFGFLPHALKRFARLDSGRSRGDEGVGLGLAIVHADANAATTAAIVAGRPGRGMAGRGRPAGPADRPRRPGSLPRWPGRRRAARAGPSRQSPVPGDAAAGRRAMSGARRIAALWFVSRSSGLALLAAFSAAVVLGVAARLGSRAGSNRPLAT